MVLLVQAEGVGLHVVCSNSEVSGFWFSPLVQKLHYFVATTIPVESKGAFIGLMTCIALHFQRKVVLHGHFLEISDYTDYKP